jgi:hypothetical protein
MQRHGVTVAPKIAQEICDGPKGVGSRIPIANNYDLRRKLEARGLRPETVTPQYCIMRRDYADGVLKTA